jgi:hypothetical protein
MQLGACFREYPCRLASKFRSNTEIDSDLGLSMGPKSAHLYVQSNSSDLIAQYSIIATAKVSVPGMHWMRRRGGEQIACMVVWSSVGEAAVV